MIAEPSIQAMTALRKDLERPVGVFQRETPQSFQKVTDNVDRLAQVVTEEAGRVG